MPKTIRLGSKVVWKKEWTMHRYSYLKSKGPFYVFNIFKGTAYGTLIQFSENWYDLAHIDFFDLIQE